VPESAVSDKPVGYWQGQFSQDGGATLYEVPQVSAFGKSYPNIPLWERPAPAVAEDAVAFIGTDGNLGWLKKPDVLYSKAVPLFMHPAPDVDTKPVAEHELKDARCECCGYMTYHREHMGCIKAVYTHPTPVVVRQLVEAAAGALEAMQSVAGEAYLRAEPVCCGSGQGNKCCGCPEPKWNAADEAIMDRLHRPQQELTAALTAAKENGL
jgi:hypothetical protein